MKKILLIICLVFCVFFIKIDVKAEIVCTPDSYVDSEYQKFSVKFSYKDDGWNINFIGASDSYDYYEDEYGNIINYVLIYKDNEFGDSNKYPFIKVSNELLTELRLGTDMSNNINKGIGIDFDENYDGTLKNIRIYGLNEMVDVKVPMSCSGTNDHPNASAPTVGKADKTTNEDNEVVNKCTYHLTTSSNVTITTSTVVSSKEVRFSNPSISTNDDKLISQMASNGDENCPDFYLFSLGGSYYAYSDPCQNCDRYSSKIATYVEPDKGNEANYTDIWSPDLGKGDCSAVEKIANDVNNYILIPLRYIVPIIFLIMTIIDFAKSVFVSEKSSDGKDISKAKNNLLRRVIISVIVYFIPNIVLMLFNLFGLVCEQPTAMILQNILFMIK